MSEAEQYLGQARAQIKETLEEVRQAVWDLRHSSANQSPISDLIELAHKVGIESGVQIETQIEGRRIPLDPITDRAFLLVGREALRNAISHGAPSRVCICIAFDRNSVRMQVRDNGKGFDAAALAPEPNRHFGIVGMRERVEQLGGVFALDSKPGQGALVSISVPILSA